MFEWLLFFFRKKKVYALVGESGTGKSFHAKLVAQKYRIQLIIDDGLLIKENRILAGHSAKKEDSFLSAVKVALFDEKSHRDDIAKRLQNEKFRKILLLGTSEKMVYKIAARLQLEPPSKIIKIDDVASPEDIEKAIRIRRIEGKHVIPVPSIEIKKRHPQIFYDAIKIFKKRMVATKGIGPIPTLHEKSIVRPEYSIRGKVIISETALSQLVFHFVNEYNKDIKIKKLIVKDSELGYRLIITIDVPYGIQLGENIKELQQNIIEKIEHFTGILIEEVNCIIDTIT